MIAVFIICASIMGIVGIIVFLYKRAGGKSGRLKKKSIIFRKSFLISFLITSYLLHKKNNKKK